MDTIVFKKNVIEERRLWKNRKLFQFRLLKMKLFSKIQKIPFYVVLVSSIGFLLIALFAMIWDYFIRRSPIRPLFIVILISILVLYLIALKLFSLVLYRTNLTDEGISLVTKKGKTKRILMWDDIKVFHVTNGSDATQYICLSTDENLSAPDRHYPKLIWIMFINRLTITITANAYVSNYCNHKIGHLKKYVGKYFYTKEEQNKIMQKNVLFAVSMVVGVCVIGLLVMIVLEFF